MTERTLKRSELDKLRQYDCSYPWTPFKILALIDRIEKLEKTVEDLKAERYGPRVDVEYDGTDYG